MAPITVRSSPRIVWGRYPMVAMRRSTSAICASDAPDLKTMIMAVSPHSGSGQTKRPRVVPAASEWSSAAGVGPPAAAELGQSRWADLGEVKEPEVEPPDRGAHERGGHATRAIVACQALCGSCTRGAAGAAAG